MSFAELNVVIVVGVVTLGVREFLCVPAGKLLRMTSFGSTAAMG